MIIFVAPNQKNQNMNEGTKYVNEFDPKSKNPLKGIQEAESKLKFNNIQSCIAVGIAAAENNFLTGIHLTSGTTHVSHELSHTIQQIKQKNYNKKLCKIYLVAAYETFHSQTQLVKQLKQISDQIFLCNIHVQNRDGANIDVKMQRGGSNVNVFVREHVVFLKDNANGVIPKNISNQERSTRIAQGRNIYETDRDSKPWQQVFMTKLL